MSLFLEVLDGAGVKQGQVQRRHASRGQKTPTPLPHNSHAQKGRCFLSPTRHAPTDVYGVVLGMVMAWKLRGRKDHGSPFASLLDIPGRKQKFQTPRPINPKSNPRLGIGTTQVLKPKGLRAGRVRSTRGAMYVHTCQSPENLCLRPIIFSARDPSGQWPRGWTKAK